MSEQSFSFSFNLPSPPGAASQPRERVVARPFDACAVTPSEALVRIAHRDSMQRLANADLMILQQCDRLKSMSGHADELCRRLGAASRGQVLESLNKLRKLGLLASERDLTDEFGRAEARGAGTRLQTLYIRSSGRPRALARGLESIAGGRCADAGIARCVVIDDTTDSAARQQIDKLIADADKRTGIRILHFGTDHRSRLADTLSRHADIDRRKLDWFLSTPNGSGQGYGCGINLALLMSAGRRFGLLDDDASLQAVFGPHDADPEHVGICSSNDYRAAFPDPGPVAPPFHEPTGFDPVTAHASWLGRTMAEVISGSGPRPARFADPTPTTLALMRAEGRIRFTVNGVFGDPGTQSPRWLFCQPVRSWTSGCKAKRDTERPSSVAGRCAANRISGQSSITA